MIVTKRTALSSPASSITTPYKLRLCTLAAFGDSRSEVVALLAAMIRCVEQDAYGRLRTLFRGLPFNHRRELGQPPQTRADDVHERLDW
jgi:hypothetical protein